jgi:hypothetical protein
MSKTLSEHYQMFGLFEAALACSRELQETVASKTQQVTFLPLQILIASPLSTGSTRRQELSKRV